MRGLKYLFTVPEGEKITEKHLTRVLVSSICSILLCMSCLVSTTWAWFSVSVENTGNVIQVGSYSITTTVTSNLGEIVAPVDADLPHAYFLPEGEYSLQIKLLQESVVGFCEVKVNGLTQGIIVLDQGSYEKELTIQVNDSGFTSTLTDASEPVPNLEIVPMWGTPAPESSYVSATLEIGESRHDRVFAVVMNNAGASLPFRGINQAEVFFEMLIEGNMTRGLALYRDVEQIDDIGSVRSVRYNFTDLAQAYGAILVHAGGSDPVMADLELSGINHMNVDGSIGYRDNDRGAAGYAYEHSLFVHGLSLKTAAAAKGFDKTAQKDTGMVFADETSAAAGNDASKVIIPFTYGEVKKTTMMIYDATTRMYTFHQYEKDMTDEADDDSKVAFTNVIVLLAQTTVDENDYYVANLTGTGTGYYACDGKMIPITWSRTNDTDPFIFTLEDGSPVQLLEGSTYIAIAPNGSQITCE